MEGEPKARCDRGNDHADCSREIALRPEYGMYSNPNTKLGNSRKNQKPEY